MVEVAIGIVVFEVEFCREVGSGVDEGEREEDEELEDVEFDGGSNPRFCRHFLGRDFGVCEREIFYLYEIN